MGAERDLAALVSFHAVKRYVQRVIGIAVPDGAMSSPEAAEAHCQAAGVTIGEVRERIMTPAVALACTMGVRQVGTGEFLAKIAPNGVVVTVCERPNANRKKLRILSRRELHRKASQHVRKTRRGSKVRP